MAKETTVEDLLARENWHEERRALRALLRDCGLDEAVKWNQLCYGVDGSNVAIIQVMKDFVAIGFFKGSLMKDPEGLLQAPGEHSQAMRRLHFTSLAEIEAREAAIRGFVDQAIAIEKQGLEVDFDEKEDIEYPAELVDRLDADGELREAFERLTPGRRRGYLIHFAEPKQGATRARRIEKWAGAILAGKGMHDR